MDYKNIKTYLDWNYKSSEEYSSGYEGDYPIFNSIKKEKYLSLKEEDRNKTVELMFKTYRNRNIYPLYYFNESGIVNEIKRCTERDVFISDGNVLDSRFTQGNTLLKFMFPNFQRAYSGIKDNKNYINSFDKFFDDDMLKGVLDFQMKYDSPIPLRLLNTMSLYRDRTPQNFSPMRAKALFERYTPKGGSVFDFSCGYGGRMLGALSSKNNYIYYGVEPNTETYDNLLILGDIIEKSLNRKNIYSISKIGSEDFSGEKESVDFAFSSPPYYNLEMYCDEETQCYNKFKNIDVWFTKKKEKTILNIRNILKKDGLYAVNISDFNTEKGKRVNFVQKWIEISEKIGFEHVETISMKLTNRGGNKNKGVTGGKSKKEEAIYVFKKIPDGVRSNYSSRKIPLYIQEKIDKYNYHKIQSENYKDEIIEWSKEYKYNNIEEEFNQPR